MGSRGGVTGELRKTKPWSLWENFWKQAFSADLGFGCSKMCPNCNLFHAAKKDQRWKGHLSMEGGNLDMSDICGPVEVFTLCWWGGLARSSQRIHKRLCFLCLSSKSCTSYRKQGGGRRLERFTVFFSGA